MGQPVQVVRIVARGALSGEQFDELRDLRTGRGQLSQVIREATNAKTELLEIGPSDLPGKYKSLCSAATALGSNVQCDGAIRQRIEDLRQHFVAQRDVLRDALLTKTWSELTDAAEKGVL